MREFPNPQTMSPDDAQFLLGFIGSEMLQNPDPSVAATGQSIGFLAAALEAKVAEAILTRLESGLLVDEESDLDPADPNQFQYVGGPEDGRTFSIKGREIRDGQLLILKPAESDHQAETSPIGPIVYQVDLGSRALRYDAERSRIVREPGSTVKLQEVFDGRAPIRIKRPTGSEAVARLDRDWRIIARTIKRTHRGHINAVRQALQQDNAQQALRRLNESEASLIAALAWVALMEITYRKIKEIP